MKRSRTASSGKRSPLGPERRGARRPGARAAPDGAGRSGDFPCRPRAGARALPALLLACLLLSLLFPDRTRGQNRRTAAVPYVPDAPGELLVGVGGSLEDDTFFPVSGLGGQLTRLGTLTISYSFASGAVFRVHGDALRVLSVDRREESSIPLDDGVDDGTTHDAGDFRLSTLFRLFGEPRGLSAGLHLEVKLPNSDEEAGIGLNTTDVFASAFGSWTGGPWRVNGDLGVGILEAPLQRFVQDDVLIYAGEVLYRPEGWNVRLSAAATGRANTRDLVPRGNEDRGRAKLKVELLGDRWRADLGVHRGYAGISPDWSLALGVARTFQP